MSNDNQEQESIESVTDHHADVDKSKRKFSKAGLTVAPVIMTLVSKPVFAAQGLSNMISGNGSGCQGDTFQGGFDVSFWKNRTISPSSDSAWSLIVGSPYVSVRVSDVFISPHILPVTGTPSPKLIDVIDNESTGWEIVLGYLNLKYYLANPSLGTYFLTMDQFWDLNDGITTTWALPSGVSFEDLIASNTGVGPGDATGGDCDS